MEPTGPETETRPPRRWWPLAIVIVVVVVLAAGAGAYVLFFAAPANHPPAAVFTWTVEGLTVDVEAAGSSDADGRIVAYDWNFGDAVTDTGLTAVHTYAAAGTYDVLLTVSDDDGAPTSASHSVTVEDRPVAKFAMARDLMTVQVDASASYAPAGTIASYAWDWGDSGPAGSGVTAVHTYAAPGRYTVTLTVTDNRAATGTSARPTSVARSTVDALLYDFFNVSFGEWWYLREPVYGDRILSNQWPHLDLYPWAGDPYFTDVFVYTLYRMAIKARNLTAFTIERPVMLPLFGDPASTGDRVQVHWYAQYLDTARQEELNASGFPVPDGFMDGFPEEWRYTYTMDYNSTRRFFNVSGDPATWWGTHTIAGPSQGPFEQQWQAWYENLGKRTFDVFSAFEWPYTVFQLDASATVTTNPDGSNTTSLRVLLVTWGQEVLTARWFHWGTGSYPNGTPTPANGWWPQELGWFEDFTFDATMYWDHVDFDWDAALGYQFIEAALPGLDGQYNTSDDEPVWSWYPQLMDYIYSDVRNPKSEMDAWRDPVTREPLTAISTHPGNPYYGSQYPVDQGYAQWDLRAGETITIILPKQAVTFHDPMRSRWNPSGIPDFVNITAPMTLRRTDPAGVGTWDETTKTFTMAGPFAMGGTAPLFDGLPRVDFGPKR